MPQTTVTDTATRIYIGSGTATIQNLDATVPIYWAKDPNVAATGRNGGLCLLPGGVPFDFDPYYEGVAGVGDIYAICPAGRTAVLAHGSF